MDELKIIDELEQQQPEWEAAFLAALVVMNSELLNRLYAFIDGLVLKGRSTAAAEAMANMMAVNTYRSSLLSQILEAGLAGAMTELTGNMAKGAGYLIEYFRRVSPDFNPVAYESVLSSVAAQTRNMLLATVDATYGRAIGEALTMGVINRATVDEMREMIRRSLVRDGLPVRSVSRLASDSLYQFTRGYSQAVAEGLNLKHYYYMGTQIESTRSFCKAHYGRVFTSAEVESWPDLHWSGKIPGTTKVSIYWYCGGYNCRHRLMPISKRLYDQLKQQEN